MGNTVVKEIRNASNKEKELIDQFVLNKDTNGEFINSVRYLSYHPAERFRDRSVFAVDEGSGEIRGVFMAAEEPNNPQYVVSHPGTTFAGIVVNRKASVKKKEETIDAILSFYEERYVSIVIKLRPEFFSMQPFGSIPYFLMRRGYSYQMDGLSNVIDLSEVHGEEDIFNLYDSTKRNQVRKVLRENNFLLTDENVIRREVWENMECILEEKHHTHITHTFDEMIDLMNRVPNHISTYHVDHINGEYGAFALIYRFKNVFHTQYLDTNYKYTGQYPNLLLIHNLIRIARKEGYTKFSFGVSTENHGQYLNYGLFNYKAGYGGGSILFAKYEWKAGE